MGKKGNWRVHSNSPIKEGVDAAELEVKVMDRFDDIRPLAVQEEQKKPKQKCRGWSVGTLDEKEPEKRRDGGQHRDAAVLSNSTFAMYMWAAVVIQTAFRDYLARKSLRALRGLQSSGGGHKVMRQASTTTHALVHIQAHREGLAAQHQMWQRGQPASRKASDGLTKAGWITSTLSAQQIEARVPERQVAALKRERALAYARTQQMRRASPMFVECEMEKAHRGWSYMERGSASKDAAAASKSVDVSATRNAKDTNVRHASLQAVTPPSQACASSELNFRARSGPWNRQSRAASPQSCDAEESGSMAEAVTASGAARSMASILTDPQFGTRYSNSGPARNGMIMDMPMVAGHLQATQSVKNKERSSRQLRTRPVGGTPPGAFNTPATMKRLSFTKADHSITPWSPLPRTGPV